MDDATNESPRPETDELLAEAEPLAPCLIHEMRHPLMGALAAERFLEKSLGPVLTNNEDWAMLKSQLDRLNELLGSYQSFFYPEQRAPTLFTVQPAIQHAVGLLAYRLRRLGKRFTLDLPQAPLEVQGAPNALLHALTNLILNALDALEEAGRDGRLQVRALVSPSGSVQIRVSDEGAGISEAVAARVFERGFTTKGPGRGSGLGLTVARRMVVAIGGSLALIPPGDPLRLPWARTELCIEMAAAQAGGVSAPGPQVEVAPTGEKERALGLATPGTILAVDDEPIIAVLFRKAFAEARLDGVVVSNAEEALRLLETKHFDLLITDKNLPGASGVELAERARRLNPAIGVILITAYASADSANLLFTLGIDDYLTKPFEIDALMERIDQVLELRRLPSRRPEARLASEALRVVLVEHDATFHGRVSRELKQLGCEELSCSDILSGLRTMPLPDAIVASAALFSSEARRELFRLRIRRPELRVGIVGEPASLSDTMAAIGLGAHRRISRTLDDAGLAAAVAGLLGLGAER